jgi:hypothetical protein
MPNQVAETVSGGHDQGFLANKRTDTFWLEPLVTGFGFLLFVVYTTWSALQGNHYWAGSYLSPFYAPLLFVDPGAVGAAPLEYAWFGAWPTWWPYFLPASPAILILIGPLAFRLTCYFYRRFYYRTYFATPFACAATPFPQKSYRGETRLLLIQNLHRYTFYIALFDIAVLAVDAVSSYFRNGQFGIGIGNIVLTLNVVFLACYTFGCHAFRHLIGGKLNRFTCNEKATCRYGIWKGVSCLNGNHMAWAWLSMFWVGFTDAYVRFVSMGILVDWNTWEG